MAIGITLAVERIRVGRAREQDGTVRLERLQVFGLAFDQTSDETRRPREAAVFRDRSKRSFIIEPEIAGVVLAFIEGDVRVIEDGLIRTEVQRFAVGDDAVEIEDDGSDGHFLTFSPA
jgi:hypothetical protein